MVQTIVFVVAIAFVTVTADQSKCLDGWAFFENSCYYIGDAGLNFADARRTCRGMDAQLAVISSREENDFIKSRMQNEDATGAWFGYMYYLDHQRVLSWENLDFGYQNFKDWPNNEEPDDGLPSEISSRYIQCAAFSKQNDWAWGSFDCGDSTGMKYVCKTCTFEQICTSRACFRLFCQQEFHPDAKRKCEALGGSLPSIRTKQERETVKKFLNQVSFRVEGWGQPGSDVWLAGSDKDSEGKWYWDINGQREKISNEVRDWRKDEPNNSGNYRRDENCMVMSVGDWKWNDVECLSDNFIMCEIPNVSAVTG